MRFPVGHANQHESAATDVPCRRMHDGEGKSGRDRSVNRIAASSHDFDSGPRSQFVHTDYDSVLRVHRFGGTKAGRHGASRGRNQQQNQ